MKPTNDETVVVGALALGIILWTLAVTAIAS